MWRFWFLALTSQLTVAKRLALSANDKEWKFSFLYLSSLILNKPSLKFPYLSCGIQLCWPARLKKITKFELNNIWKSETPAPVVLYLSSSFQASFIPAELWKENFPLLPFNYPKKIKISFLKSRPQANSTLFWYCKLISTQKYISFGNKSFSQFPLEPFANVACNCFEKLRYKIEMVDSFVSITLSKWCNILLLIFTLKGY